MKLIDKDALVAEIKNLIERAEAERVLYPKTILAAKNYLLIEDYKKLLSFLDTIEVKEVDLMMHTIIAECCNWLAMNTNLSHDETEDCRNLMLTVKEEQCKA